MKSAWIGNLGDFPGNAPPWKTLQAFGVQRVFVPANDLMFTTEALLDTIRDKGFIPGLFRDPRWTNASAKGLAQIASDDIGRLTNNKLCTYDFDIEAHDPRYVLDWLAEWRRLRATRATRWTLEPMQGGWFSPDLVQALNADPNLVVCPQTYTGDMRDFAPDEVYNDIASRGVKRVEVFRNGHSLPTLWSSGTIYLAEYLPVAA